MRWVKRKGPPVAIAVALAAAGWGSAAGAAPPPPKPSVPIHLAAFDYLRVGSWPKSTVLGDFTGDGRLDVVVSTRAYFDPTNDNKLFLFEQTPTGTLQPPLRLATDGAGQDDAMSLAAGDVDGDGRTDVVLATLRGPDVFLQRNGGLSLTRLVDLPGARSVSLTDLDADGRLDVVVNTDAGLRTLRGTGGGAFAPPVMVNAFRYVAMETADVTGDGLVDIVGVRESGVDVLARRANGTFADPVRYRGHDYWNRSTGLAVGDLNGDGRTDVAVSLSVNRPRALIDVFPQTPGGTLGPAVALPSYDIPQALVAADMNLDGRTDLVTLHGGWSKAGVYLQDANGTMEPEALFPNSFASHFPPTTLAVGDFSGDGLPDLAVADNNYSLVVTRSATQLRSWGLGNYGQLGRGSTAGSATPSPPLALADIGTASTGAYHQLALGRDGHIRSWGLNHAGQLGDGSTVDHSSPTLVVGIDHVVDVGAGAFHSLAVKDDGTAWAWGSNGYGQLGTGSTADRPLPTPVQVPGGSPVTAVAGGATHSMAVTADGNVWAWGLNHVGQLGTGDTTDHLVPVKVPGPTGVVAVAAGLYHSLALTADGVVWSWGYNNAGQLGTEAPAPFDPTPRIVTSLTSSTSVIAAGAFHTLALSVHGTVSAWGLNHVGQLGDGSTQYSAKPVNLAIPGRFRSVAAGWYHSFALGTQGATFAWGWNYFGQLGTGTTTDALSPTEAPGVDASLITAGATHSLAITARGG